jgi:hypothetical protein
MQGRGENEYWVGDVAEQFRLGRVSKEIAAADGSPIKPLVDRPQPFHGYLVRAMNSGPDLDWNVISLKGKNVSKETYGFCIYPAESNKKLRTYLVCPWGIFGNLTDENRPVLDWPRDIRSYQSGWCLID